MSRGVALSLLNVPLNVLSRYSFLHTPVFLMNLSDLTSPFSMAIQPDQKPHVRSKISMSAEQKAQNKMEQFAADQYLHLAIEAAIEHITEIIDDVADEYNKSFKTIGSLVHLSGTVFKQHRAPTIQNALSYCWAHVKDGRCMSILLLFYSDDLLTKNCRGE